ncbi:MAG TPA: hypothetical protein VHL99_09545, partial [Candidatus Binatia bacterium]|nr:hypothetical protein [Candidatus Binatia bacterium]
SGPDYSVEGEGSVGLDKSLQWDATLTLAPELAQEAAQQRAELRPLIDRSGKLAVPFQLSGTLGRPRVTPRLKSDAAPLR